MRLIASLIHASSADPPNGPRRRAWATLRTPGHQAACHDVEETQ